MAELLDILKSGDVQDLAIGNNILYLQAEDDEYNGMFLRIQDGKTTLYRQPDNDTHFIDVNSAVVPFNAEVEILRVAVDTEITEDDGSYVITMMLDNLSNKDAEVDVIVKTDDVFRSSQIVTLAGDQIAKNVILSNYVSNAIPAGTEISVHVEGTQDMEVRGDLILTKIDITKAAAATLQLVQTAIEKHDYMLVIPTTQNLQTTLTRAEIESVIQAAGIDLPTVNVSFKIRDNSNHVFAVSYLKDYDEYGYERLTVAN